ncbi:MAG TPA: SDR family oxidoreductase [Xanthobacteraceae bacterium]|nr:SDR family oxidoreductase [Xanthobacteraceae bacterium]
MAKAKRGAKPAVKRNSSAKRAAIVTGGASGIGLACAEALVGAGWRVGILDRDEAALERARKRFRNERAVRIAQLDVTDEPAAVAAVDAMATAFGRLDGLLNSAGIGADVHVLDTPVELFRKVLDINVTGTFIVGRAAARIMKDRGGGAIVNVGSIAGVRGSKGRVAYGASKGAVATLTKVMAVDLARFNIRVNAIAPGPVETPLVKAIHTPEVRRGWLHHVPMRRYAAPEEMAGTVLFLLDPAQSGYLTGEVIAVDGGFRGAGMMLIEE